MAVKERDVVLQGTDSNGERTIDLPITALRNIEDTTTVKTTPVGEDLIPIIDSAEENQMKKIKYSDLKVAVTTMTDDTDGTKYHMGVDNGGLYIEEVK